MILSVVPPSLKEDYAESTKQISPSSNFMRCFMLFIILNQLITREDDDDKQSKGT